MESITAFAARIKSKYPDYNEIPDAELVQRVITKHPEYRDVVDLGAPESSSNTGTAGGMGDVKMAESQTEGQADGLLHSNIFPTAANVQGVEADRSGQNPATGRSYGPPSGAAVLPAMADLANAPSRFVAQARGMKMSDPESYLLRPEVDAAQKNPVTPFANSYANQNFAGTSEIAGRTASDPLTWVSGLFSALETAPAHIRNAIGGALKSAVEAPGKGAEFVNKQAGRLASDLSGAPEEALRAYGDPVQRAKMAANYGKENEIGHDLLSHIENPDQHLPERAQVNEALKNMGDIPVQSAVDAMEGAKGQSVAGRLSPEKAAANAGINKYIDFLRGGPAPEDLAQSATAAGRDLESAQTESALAKVQAGADAKDASQAVRAQKSAQSEVGSLGAEIKNRQKYGTDFGWWHDETLQQAQDAAAKAKEAAISARAKLATGEISKADYATAQAAETAAERAAQVADAASKLYSGTPIKQVAEQLTRDHGLDVPDLRDVLTKARAKAQGVPTLPDQTVSATDYRKLRQDLDVPVKWDEEGGQIKNNALIAGRTTMKNELLKKAAESGNPDYATWMQSYSDKLDKLDRIKKLLGKTGEQRSKRVEQFVNNLFGKNSEYKQQLMNDLDEVFQSDLVGRAKSADMAASLGEGGKPSLMPRHLTGASLKAGLLANMIPGVGTAAAIGTASPLVAARITLPVLTKLEAGLKAAGVAMTPRGNAALAALRRATTSAQKARLAEILAAELENTMPANAIPFPTRKVAQGPDSTQQYSSR